jgi:hypothetical protein
MEYVHLLCLEPALDLCSTDAEASADTLKPGCVIVTFFDFDLERANAKGPNDPNSIDSSGGPFVIGKDGK